MYAVLQSSNKKDTKTYILLTGSQQPVLKPQILNFLLENLLVYIFFRKKLQIVFLCKLNSYTYLVYFDSSKKPVFDQIKTNIKKILAS